MLVENVVTFYFSYLFITSILTYVFGMCRSFKWVGPKWERLPSGVLGLLIKRLYPGIIALKKDGVATGEKVPAWSWNHFTMVPDSTHGHLGMRLITEFWVSNLYNFTTLIPRVWISSC